MALQQRNLASLTPRRVHTTHTAEIGNLRNLSVLNVRCNRLTHLPGEIGWLRASASLFLAENPFCEATEVQLLREKLGF